MSTTLFNAMEKRRGAVPRSEFISSLLSAALVDEVRAERLLESEARLEDLRRRHRMEFGKDLPE